MSLVEDIRKFQESLEQIQSSLNHNGGPEQVVSIKDDIQVLLDVLNCPVFESILCVQNSLQTLSTNIKSYPSLLPDDFDIDPRSLELKVNIPASDVENNNNNNTFDYDNRTIPSKFSLQKYISESSEGVAYPPHGGEPDYVNITQQQEYAFQRKITELAQGRYVQTVQMFKPEGQSLGFKVVGLSKGNKFGIYIQEIHKNGIAANNGFLRPDDQILAIDDHIFTSDLSHSDAINILQGANGVITLVAARGEPVPSDHHHHGDDNEEPSGLKQAQDLVDGKPLEQTVVTDETAKSKYTIQRKTSEVSVESHSGSSSKDSNDFDNMVLNTEWTQVEQIQLENDGTGLGFGIVGGRSSGVIVKTIVGGGVADRDNRLQLGDHILQINEIPMRGMSSDQVAQILRQSGSVVVLVVARPVDPTSDLNLIQNTSTIVPTRNLSDLNELKKTISSLSQEADSALTNDDYGHVGNSSTLNPELSSSTNAKIYVKSYTSNNEDEDAVGTNVDTGSIDKENISPEMESFEVELVKDQHGLGITIAGYVCEKAEEISGIFIKSIAPDSVAEKSGLIAVNDQIIEVDGHSLYGYNNLQAVDLLRNTGRIVKLKLSRLIKQNSESGSIAKPSQARANSSDSSCNKGSGATVIPIVNDSIKDRATMELVEKWAQIIGPEFDIIVAKVTKFCHDGGLGISLEGTIDIENGQEVRPHHYINSILETGPVGRNRLLRKGDELLEVNGIRLHGLRHSDVLPLLKDLPIEVQLICARPKFLNVNSMNLVQQLEKNDHGEVVQNMQNAFNPATQQPLYGLDRLVKAKSDGSLAITTLPSSASVPSSGLVSELNKIRSRSMEPLSGLAMWSSEPHIIELVKGDRGLGFSILDYQDPMNPNESIIVIRSLVPGGIAQQDGRLLPGDRLLFVNDQNLENATLDVAVQALKGAPMGVVVVGVAKPLPLPESTLQLASGEVMQQVSRSDEVDDRNHNNYTLHNFSFNPHSGLKSEFNRF